MAEDGLRLEITGEKEVEERLRRFGDLIADMDLLWDRYTVIMVEIEKEWFATAGKGSWPKLAKSTLAKKLRPSYRSRGRRGPFTGGPLIATGLLRDELTSPTAGKVDQGRSSLGTFTRSVFSWGTEDDVARYHWTGRTKPNVMPSRPPIEWPPSPATMARFERANEEFAEEAARESGVK